METEKQEDIAMFRFAVISPLLGIKRKRRGERERKLRELTQSQWDIPYSSRSYIARSTILEWLKRYERSNGKLFSLYPEIRQDKGGMRSMDKETQQTLVNFRKQNMDIVVGDFLKLAKDRGIVPPEFKASIQSVYRLLRKHGLIEPASEHKDLRSFEAELPNDLWQSDCMHGPWVIEKGKKRKAFLFASIDDHSRLIPHAEFYLRENLDNYMNCLHTAISKRGLPRKLYLDNGPSFRSRRLKYTTASLGIALIHSSPYCPEGKGKIERWFRTLRRKFLAPLSAGLTLRDLNEELWRYLNHSYHITVHTSTGEAPFERFSRSLHLVRSTPDDLDDYFRIKCKRKVLKDRTVSLDGVIFEVPLGLIGKTITLMFRKNEPEKVEAFYQEKSYGLLQPLDRHVNYRVKRKAVLETSSSKSKEPGAEHQSGKLF